MVDNDTRTVPNQGLKEDLARLARTARQGLIDVPQASAALGLDRKQTSRRLSDLSKSGWLSRVRRGLYFLRPLEALPGRPAVPEDPWVFASVVYRPCYIGGWSAAEHWDLTEQLFRETFVVTTRNVRATQEELLGLRFRLVRIASVERISGTQEVWRGSERVNVSSPERTLVDGLNDPGWIGGLRHLLSALARFLDSDPNLENLRTELDTQARGVAFKRLGYLLEQFWPEYQELVLFAKSRHSRGVVRLDPKLPARGRLDSRWGLWVNTALLEGFRR